MTASDRRSRWKRVIGLVAVIAVVTTAALMLVGVVHGHRPLIVTWGDVGTTVFIFFVLLAVIWFHID